LHTFVDESIKAQIDWQLKKWLNYCAKINALYNQRLA